MLLTPKRPTITIGIFGSNGKTSTANLMSSIFSSAGLVVKIISDKNNVANKRKMANIEAYKKLKKLENNDIIIIEVTEDYLKNDSLKEIDFNILVHCNISEGSYEHSTEGISKINSIINSYRGTKMVILNTDDVKWKDIAVDLENTFLITYGLGSKATVTASSIECSNYIKFCYCLQRSIPSFNNEIIEPMEVPFIVKAPGQYNVYNGIAAITTALICNVQVDEILHSLSSNIIKNSGLNILYENGPGVIDNVCDTILSFETGFDAVQHYHYENVHLIFNINTKDPDNINNKKIDIISTWSLILNIKKVYFLNNSLDVSLSNYFSKLKNTLINSNVEIDSIEGKAKDIERILSSLKDKDLLLFFCSSEFNFLRNEITDILDRYILRGVLQRDST